MPTVNRDKPGSPLRFFNGLDEEVQNISNSAPILQADGGLRGWALRLGPEERGAELEGVEGSQRMEA